MQKIFQFFQDVIRGYSEDSEKREKEEFIKIFLLLAFVLVFVLVIDNIISFLAKPSLEQENYLIQDFIVIAFLGFLWVLNRRSYRVAGYLFLLCQIVGVSMLFSVHNINDNFLLFVFPIISSGFIISAKTPFVIAFLSTLAYAIIYSIEMPDFRFNYLSVSLLIFISFTTWIVAQRLEKALKRTFDSERKYVSLIENNPAFVYSVERGKQEKWIYASPQIKPLLGYTPQEWMELKNPWISQIHPDDRLAILDKDKECQKSGVTFQAEYRLHSRDGTWVWVNDLAEPMQSPDNPTFLQGLMFDITPRKRNEQTTRVSINISQAAFSTKNLDDFFHLVHSSLGELMSVKNFFIALYDKSKDILSFPYFVDEFDPPMPSGKPQKGLTDYVLRTGKPLLASPEIFEKLVEAGEVQNIGTPSIDWIGVPLHGKEDVFGVMVAQTYSEGSRYTEEDLRMFTFVANNIALAIERLQAEKEILTTLEEKTALLREVHHRVKNNLQVISSLLHLQSDFIHDDQDRKMFEDTQSRVKSIAFVHELLYQTQNLARIDFGDYIESITFHLVNLYTHNPNVRIRTEIDPLEMNVDTAIPCGLIINELISNSFRYAFPDNRQGEIFVKLKRQFIDEKEICILTISDDGIGIPEYIIFPNKNSLGLQLVDILTRQLGGKVTLDREKGAVFTIQFPLRN
jgi:PAS domain S-box-containing protein